MSEAKRILNILEHAKALEHLSESAERLMYWIDLKRIVEVGGAKLSKLHQYIADDNTPFAQISAFTGSGTKKQNIEQQAGLLFDLKQVGFVVIATRGFWGGKKERSFFVAAPDWDAEQFKQVIASFAQKYGQETFIVGSKGDVREYGSISGQTVRKFSRVGYDPTKIEDNSPHARIKDRKFSMIEEAAVFGGGPVRASQSFLDLGLVEAVERKDWKQYR